MSDLYNRIQKLCDERGITVTTMCKESGASRGSLTDLNKGRKQKLSAETLSKIATYFGVSLDYLCGREELPPTEHKAVTDDDIKYALFGGGAVTDAQYAEVKQFVNFIKERDANGSAH